MADRWFLIAFFVYCGFGLLMAMFDLIGGSLYDLREINKLKQLLRHPHAKRFRWRPLVSVIIPAHNEAAVIERCLRSITDSSYHKYEIVVVDDASTDDTKRVVTKFIKNHPKLTIRLLAKRRNVGRGGAINAGFKKWAKGELIMALDADSTLQRHTLRNAVRHFAIDKVSALAANVRIMPERSVIGILQQFEYLTSFRSKKFNTLSNSEYIIGGSGAIYSREIFKKLKGFNETMWTEDIALSLAIAQLGNKQFRLKYASDVVVYTEAVPSYLSLFQQRYRWKLGSLQALFAHKRLFFTTSRAHTKLLGWFRLPLVVWGEFMLLLEPVLITYFLYVAIAFDKPILYIISWAIVSVLLAFVVWGDEHFSLGEKLRLSLFIPVMYSLFYIMTVVQIAAVFKSLFNNKKITGQTPIRGSWKPPERQPVA